MVRPNCGLAKKNMIPFFSPETEMIFMTEAQFQAKLIKRLKVMFPDCIVMKNDSGYIQGIPDLTILWNDKWAFLECKKSENDRKRPQPNQEIYIAKASDMSFGAFIFPENEEVVLRDLQRAFGVTG